MKEPTPAGQDAIADLSEDSQALAREVLAEMSFADKPRVPAFYSKGLAKLTAEVGRLTATDDVRVARASLHAINDKIQRKLENVEPEDAKTHELRVAKEIADSLASTARLEQMMQKEAAGLVRVGLVVDVGLRLREALLSAAQGFLMITKKYVPGPEADVAMMEAKGLLNTFERRMHEALSRLDGDSGGSRD